MEKNFTILCVDDEENILHSIKRTLAMENYNILTAESGAKGLEVFNAEEIDLVISDQRMPNMSGYEFLKIVREKYPECVRIMLSGFSDFESLVKTINDGEIIRFVSKPWDNEELKNVIRSTLVQSKVFKQVHKILENMSNMVEMVNGLKIETSQENNTVTVKIFSDEKVTDDKGIYKVLEFLFKTFNIESKEGFNVLSSSISREEKGIILEIDLVKGVKLKIQVEREHG